MANFIPSKKTAQDFNNGVQYIGADTAQGISGDKVQAETINNLVESALYSQQVVEDNEAIANNAIDTANKALAQVEDQVVSYQKVVDLIYPIGSICVQFSGELPPAERFPFSTWVIDTSLQGRTLIGSGGSYNIGATGGSATHLHSAGLNDISKTKLSALWQYNYVNNQPVFLVYSVDSVRAWTPIRQYPVTTSQQAYAGAGRIGSVAVIGETDETTVMPPYAVVNYWKRTA